MDPSRYESASVRRLCHVHPEQVTDLGCVTSGSRTRYRERAATKCRVDRLERGWCCWRMDRPGRLDCGRTSGVADGGAASRGRSCGCPAPLVHLGNSGSHSASWLRLWSTVGATAGQRRDTQGRGLEPGAQESEPDRDVGCGCDTAISLAVRITPLACGPTVGKHPEWKISTLGLRMSSPISSGHSPDHPNQALNKG